MMLENIKIILGSQSPRRKQLLEEAGFNIQVETKDVDESFPSDMPTDMVAEYIAKIKSEAYSYQSQDDIFIITADSIVVLDGVIYGKPKDHDHAFEMIKALQNKVHQVYTGVCIRKGDRCESFTELSIVTMSAMTDEEINYYLYRAKPYDKAGSYGIQDWIGLCKVSRIEGTFANIMGLPVHRIYDIIHKW